MSEPIWKHEKELLVVVGGWNANILLNTEWLKKYLFTDQGEFNVEFPLSQFPKLPIISIGRTRISLSGQRLSLCPLGPDVEELDRIEETASKIANFLPHTPVTAAGVNFFYELGKDVSVDACLSKTVTDVLAESGEIKAQACQYTLPSEKARLTISLNRPESGNSSCALNFHYSLSSLADLKELLEECRIARHKERADEIVQTLVATLSKG